MALDKVDEALAHLGRYSRWHILIMCVIAVPTSLPSCWSMLSIIFTGLFPYGGYHCNVTDPRSIPGMVSNSNETTEIDRCNVYVNWTQGNKTQACPNGYAYTLGMEPTIVTEWNLVCHNSWMKDLSQMVFSFGMVIGALVFTTLADLFGRKPIFILTNFGLMATGVITAVSPDFNFFVILRVLSGAFEVGLALTGFLMALELYPADQRTYVGQCLTTTWGLAMMILALIGYVVRNWRHFYLTISIPFVISVIESWFIPESIPWLVSNGRHKEAEVILRKAAKFNNVDMPEHLLNLTEDSLKSSENNDGIVKERPTVFLTHPRLRLYTFLMIIIWFVNALVYYGLQLSSADLGGDLYIIIFVAGIVETVAYFHTIWVLEKFGRRYSLCFYHLLTAAGLIISILIPTHSADGTNLNGLIIFFNMIGRFGIGSSFSVVYLYAGEVFPVNVRTLGMGLCCVGSQTAGLIAPFSSTVMQKIPWLPAVIFGGLCVLAGLICLILPETLHRVLPQTVADLDTWSRKKVKAEPEPHIQA